MEIKQKIQYLPVQSLKVHPDNPRKIDEKQFDILCKSIKDNPEYFETRPILCNKEMFIIAGNMRYRAAVNVGLAEVPVAILDLPLQKQKEIMLRDNHSSGMWDWDKLANQFDVNFLFEIGFTESNLGFTKPEPKKSEPILPDNVNPTKTALGQVWALGDHRLLVGDCTDKTTVDNFIQGKHVELLFTSPPYSDMREYNGDKDLTLDKLTGFFSAFYPYAKYQAVNLGIQRKNHEVFQYWDEYIKAGKASGYKFLSWNVWDKGTAGSIGNQSAFFPIEHEWIFIFGKEFKDINRTEERNQPIRTRRSTHREKDGSINSHSVGRQDEKKELGTVYLCPPETTDIRDDHPAVFPAQLPRKYIDVMTNKGDIVVDPFLGSGSTLIACEQTGRICYGVELDPRYADVVIKRWEVYTGRVAELVK